MVDTNISSERFNPLRTLNVFITVVKLNLLCSLETIKYFEITKLNGFLQNVLSSEIETGLDNRIVELCVIK